MTTVNRIHLVFKFSPSKASFVSYVTRVSKFSKFSPSKASFVSYTCDTRICADGILANLCHWVVFKLPGSVFRLHVHARRRATGSGAGLPGRSPAGRLL